MLRNGRAFRPGAPHASRSRCRSVACAASGDVLVRSLSDLGEVAVLVCDGTALVQEVRGPGKLRQLWTTEIGFGPLPGLHVMIRQEAIHGHITLIAYALNLPS